MKVEELRQEGGAVVVETTGATFSCSENSLAVTAKIPRMSEVVTWQLEGSGPWHMVQETSVEVMLKRGPQTITIGDDGFVEFASEDRRAVTMSLLFSLRSFETNDQAADYRGDGFGCGVYRLKGQSNRCDTRSRFTIDRGSSLFFHVFPPRLPNPDLARAQIAHEGRPRSGEELPHPDLIAAVSQQAQIFALHAYFWREEFPQARPRFSRYRFRPNPWRSAVHEPLNEDQFRQTIDVVHNHGMRFLPYVSPRHSLSHNMLEELQRLTSFYDLDGFYLDGLRGNFLEQRSFIRALRRQLGPKKIIYLNGSDQPFGSPRITAPFIDSHCDFVLRGDSGKGGLSRDTFLQRCVSGIGGGNQVGVWCHYGSSGWPFPFDRVPSRSDQNAAARAGVMIWRRSFWWPGQKALARFDLVNSKPQ